MNKQDPLGRLPLWICAGWGMGTVSVLIVLTASNTILLAFLTNYVGIAPALASALIAASKVYDAFADPTMGVISDRTETRIGRRRPYVLVGGFLLAVSIIALFSDPPFEREGLRIAYVTFVLFFWATAYTVFNVPYLSMPAEMTSGYHDRTRLMTFRVYGVGLAQLLAATWGPTLIVRFGGGAAGHQMMALILAPIVLTTALICFWMTKDAPFAFRPHENKAPFLEQLKLVLKNKPFFLLIGMKFFTLMSLGTQSAQAYFFTRILKQDYTALSFYFFLYSSGMILSQPFWLWISGKVGKRNALLGALASSLPIALSWFLANADEPSIFVAARGLLSGIYGGGMIMVGQAMLPDTMEYDFRRTGLRREGLFAGVYTTVEKLSGAIGVAVVGTLLSAMGYVASRGEVIEQPESVNTAIYLAMAAVPFAINLGAILIMLGYDLTEEKLKATPLIVASE